MGCDFWATDGNVLPQVGIAARKGEFNGDPYRNRNRDYIEDVMRIKYHTSKGSIYTHTFEGGKDYWVKEDTDGEIHPLVEALHISKSKLQELIKEYPSTLLDKTYCFDVGVEKEFFEDAKKERYEAMFEAEETVVIFLVKREPDRYAIGCSSEVVDIEKIE